MKFGSVCSGIEAASVAWHPLGWSASWFSEIEPFPSAVLSHHYPDVPNLGDMTKIAKQILLGDVEAPDVLCGGTPCQAFSVAGLRQSLDDARGNLTLKFVELADAIDHVRTLRGQQPAIVFWENVPGVLSTKDNAFGCFLTGLAGEDEPLVAPGGKWSNAGAVFGPKRAVAWRTLDAQYFGLAQRRRRVFVVASARDGFDPCQVLLEWDGVRRDSAPSREAGEVAPCIPSRSTAGGGLGTDFDLDGGLIGHANAEGSTGLPFLTCSNVGKTVNNQTPLLAVTHSLRGEGFDASEDGTGRGTPRVPAHVPEVAGTMKACKDSGGWSNSADHAAAGYMLPVAFVQNTRDEVRLMGGDGSLVGALAAETGAKQQCYVAFAIQAGALRTNPNSGPDGVGVQADHAYTLEARAEVQAVAFQERGRSDGPELDIGGDVAYALTAPNGGGRAQERNVLTPNMQVRRLTPVECERLQGFPDNHTAIPWRKKPASECPDGPRYKALGNSWAVPVVRWIGERIARAAA